MTSRTNAHPMARNNKERSEMNHPSRECVWCGTVFQPHHAMQIYCRMNCSCDAANERTRERQEQRRRILEIHSEAGLVVPRQEGGS